MKYQIPKEKLTPVGKLIRQFRTERDLTLGDLVATTGYTKAYWSGVERGSIDATDEAIRTFVGAYELDNLENWIYKNSISKKIYRIKTNGFSDEFREMVYLVSEATEKGVIPQEMINYVIPTLKFILNIQQET